MSDNSAPADPLGAGDFLDAFKVRLDSWKGTVPNGIREIIDHQFTNDSKFFRPLTIFACAKAAGLIDGWQGGATGNVAQEQEAILRRAHVIEMIHNVTLIMDDVVDRSPQRRGQLVPHSRCSPLTAFMVSGYLIAESYEILAEGWLREGVEKSKVEQPSSKLCESVKSFVATYDWVPDECGSGSRIEESFFLRERLQYLWCVTEVGRGTGLFDHRLISELLKRLAVVECLQWDFRQDGALMPARMKNDAGLGLADWYFLAREDTGSMFEICACMGAQSQRYRRFGRLLGMLYHGADDVSDLAELSALGGTGGEDISDRILTLPAALALRRGEDFRKKFGRREVRDALQNQLFPGVTELSDVQGRDLEVMIRAFESLSPGTRSSLKVAEWWNGWVPKTDRHVSSIEDEVKTVLRAQLVEARTELERIKKMAMSEIGRAEGVRDQAVLENLVGKVYELSEWPDPAAQQGAAEPGVE